jgi:hypothetical protein
MYPEREMDTVIVHFEVNNDHMARAGHSISE